MKNFFADGTIFGIRGNDRNTEVMDVGMADSL